MTNYSFSQLIHFLGLISSLESWGGAGPFGTQHLPLASLFVIKHATYQFSSSTDVIYNILRKIY